MSSQGVQDLGASLGAAAGLDSLADELADAWDEDDAVDDTDVDRSNLGSSVVEPANDAPSGPTLPRTSPSSPDRPAHHRHRSRKVSGSYDGADYEDGYPVDMSPSLKACLADVEGLAKQGVNADPSQKEDVIARVVDALKDLGGQAGVENGATRLITAHTSLSMHLAQQTRTLQTLTYALLSPLSFPPDEEEVNEILPLIVDSMSMIPQPMLDALTSLAQLSHGSKDLIDTLGNLSDSLHMSRQITNTASRSLKSARELVAEIRRENTAADEGMRFVEEGKWQKKLADRECARVCQDVVGGFEEVCEGWRQKLVASAEVSAAS